MSPEVDSIVKKRRYWIGALLILVLLLAVSLMFVRQAASPSEDVDDGPVTGGGSEPPPPPPPAPAPPQTGGNGAVHPVDLEPFRRFSKQLVDGVVAFDYPEKMSVGDRADVTLRVSVQKTLDELRDSVAREARNPIAEPAKLSPRMRADLHGFGFDVTSLNSGEQVVDADDDTTWSWDVRATEAGKQRLTVTLTAVIDVGDSEGARDVSTFYREVEVEALPKSWWQNAVSIAQKYGPSREIVWPAIPTAVAAVWAFVFARRRVRKKRARRA
jgi:hypothetical protein